MMQRPPHAEIAALASQQLVDASLRPLLGHRLPQSSARRQHVNAGLLAAGASPMVAHAIAQVPRSPFTPAAAWRLADALCIALPGLPAPRDIAAMLDGLLLTKVATLVTVSDAGPFWCTVVAGVLAALLDLRVATTGEPGSRPQGLADSLAALGVSSRFDTAAPQPDGPYGYLLCEPSARPPSELAQTLAPGDCIAWSSLPDDRGAPGRLLRLHRREDRLILTDLGEAI